MDLPTELVYEILSYCNPDDYSQVCLLWKEISRHQQQRSYIERVIAQLGNITEFVNSCDETYITNWH